MIYDLVKTAVHIKMKCITRNDLISSAEFCYAVGYCMNLLKMHKEFIEEVMSMNTVHDIREKMKTIIEPKIKAFDKDRDNQRLLYMVMECKLEKDLDAELKGLIQMGLQG
jgi:hypothetical protein